MMIKTPAPHTISHALPLAPLVLAVLLSACGGSGQQTDQASATPNTPPPAASMAAVSVQPAGAATQLDRALTMQEANAILRGDANANAGSPSFAPAPATSILPALAIDSQNREAVRSFYNGLYTQTDGVAMGWTGDYGNGNAGAVSTAYQEATLLRINWIRALAGVPANVSFDPAYSASSQQAAYMMSVNKQLSHTPTTSWKFYTADGAEAAGRSNLAFGNAGPDAISSAYLADSGSNNAAVGHRRWLLYPQTQTMGSGSVPGRVGSSDALLNPANSLWIFDNNLNAARPQVRDDFIAWPPRGYVPYPLVFGRWSFSYKNADFSHAKVTVSKAGVNIPVTLEAVSNGYGENTLVWLLQGSNDASVASKPEADESYSVMISNVMVAGSASSFSYTVTVFDPARPGTGAGLATISSSGNAEVNNATSFQLNPLADSSASSNASAYKLAFYRRSAFNGQLPAQYLNNTWLSAGSDYIVGNTAFYFSRPEGTAPLTGYRYDAGQQSLTYKGKLLAGNNAVLEFDKIADYAGSSESLKLQVSTDNGASWTDEYRETGTGFFQASSRVRVDLSRFAGKLILFRFAYVYVPGRPYNPADGSTGWRFSNIALANVDQLLDEQSSMVSNSAGNPSLITVKFSFANAGDYAGFVSTQYQGRYFSDWGNPHLFRVNAVGSGTGSSNGGGNNSGSIGATVSHNGNVDGKLADYVVSKTSNGYQLTSKTGNVISPVAAGATRINFKDASLAFDVDGKAGQAYRLYQAAFGRIPDQGGLGYWIRQMDRGMDMNIVAASFMQSPEFKNLYGGTNPAIDVFLTTLYKNILGRAPDLDGYNYWKAQIQANKIQLHGVLASFSESAENKALTSATTQSGIAYLPYGG